MMTQYGAQYIQLIRIQSNGIVPKSIIYIYEVLLFYLFIIFNLNLRIS